MESTVNVATKALKLYFGNKLSEANVNSAESAKSFVHKWLDAVEYGNQKLAIKYLAFEIRKRIDSGIDYNELWKV
jgi:hypothetical protein